MDKFGISTDLLAVCGFIWFCCAIVSAVIAATKGRSTLGWFFLGLPTGPFGSLVVALLPSMAQVHKEQAQILGESGEFRKCPFCAEVIRKEADKCRYCGSDISASSRAGMPTKITCPNPACGQIITIKNAQAGPNMQCPFCKTQILMVSLEGSVKAIIKKPIQPNLP